MKKNPANIVTSFRLIGALILIFISARSPAFLIIYALCGASDALDGFIARKTHTESELGKKLDSISDLSLYCVMLMKVWPLLQKALPKKKGTRPMTETLKRTAVPTTVLPKHRLLPVFPPPKRLRLSTPTTSA